MNQVLGNNHNASLLASLVARALWVILFTVCGYFINQNDKAIELARVERRSLEIRLQDHIRESFDKETILAGRLARIEEQVGETNRILRNRDR